jgi:hypothetical protein
MHYIINLGLAAIELPVSLLFFCISCEVANPTQVTSIRAWASNQAHTFAPETKNG